MVEVKIPLDWPNIGELEKRYVLEAMDSGYVSTAGPLVQEFEKRFAAYLAIEHAVAVMNGTSGLHLALKLLGIGPGDEVIVPALTFIATVNPVTYVGATPVVVDVCPDTWTIDPLQIEGAIGPRTRAIIPVHLYGNPAHMEAVMDIAERYGLYVIEDATEALGATYFEKPVGTIGHIGVFSFNGNKVITTGGGGMLVARDPDLAKKARNLVNQGRDASQPEYDHQEIGYNYRLTNLQAALGLAQLERLTQFLDTKRSNAQVYKDLLKGVRGISWQKETEGAESNWWLFSITVDKDECGKNKTELMECLRYQGIQVRSLFKPINLQPCYQLYFFKPCPVAENIYNRGLNLPSASFLADQDIRMVCSAIIGG